MRRCFHVQLQAIGVEAMVGGSGHMLTKLERPIKKLCKSITLVANWNVGLTTQVLTSWASFGDDETGLESSSCSHMCCAFSYASEIICIKDIVANASTRPGTVSNHAMRRYFCNVS